MIEKFECGEYPFLPRYESLLFTYVLLALGYKARWVTCMPIDMQYSSCMYVTEVFLSQLKKWVAIDICNNCIYYNKQGVVLNIFEMRKHILEENNIIVYNLDEKINDKLYELWASYLFRFKYILNNEINMLNKHIVNCAILTPKELLCTDKTINYYAKDSSFVYKYYSNAALFY